ncbi:rod shape-determining protein RodA [Altericroceibacterium xinjiangense]|uniref:rod shape-determining protein RodA n=1 Tax=Altericroceibacterium xinjiangense TaxID=762261 RepID=UPI000F7D9EBE|nr:rod shape-determining protein RodA [Altericroceibacterium xinjiangense]
MNLSFVPAPLALLPWRIIFALVALTCFGALVLYSAAGGSFQPYAFAQLVRFSVFLVLAFGMSLLRRDLVFLAAYPVYGIVVGMLVLVEVLGAVKGGSQRWLNLGPIVLQPSELMKPAIVLVLASFYHSLPAGLVGSWRALVPAAVLMGIPIALVLLQPDLGTTISIAFVGVIVMFLAGLPMKWFIAGGVMAAIAAPLLYFFGLHDYQRQRVTTFLDPESDPLGTGYHITQSEIAIGSGGVFGKGFGNGSQSHLNYLPEAHTDFVFATMAEEWGLAGGLFVLLIFGMVLRWGMRVGRNAPDRFSRLMAAGMTATIFFYVMINTMMVMGLAPVVGIPLPFMSYGGSSMLTNMICIGTLMMIDRWSRQARPPSYG